jgi:hypothetical protein
MTSSIGRPSSLPIDITDEAAAQVLLWMGQNDGGPGSRVLEHVMRAGHAFENPAFAFQTALYVTAVG